MKITVIGATGHVGSYLVPQLVEAGHEVVAVSRGTSEPYVESPAWESVRRVVLDREREESEGTFGPTIAALGSDAVVDMICFTEQSARHLVESLRGRAELLVHVGTIWVHGTAVEVPIREDAPRHPWGEYGIQKAAIERLLLEESAAGGLRCTIAHPGHISGPGWPIINPVGNLDLDVWRRLSSGEPVAVPNLGLETVHHVHPADVAQLIALALASPDAAAGQAFHAVSERALTLRGFAESVAGWFGQEPRLDFMDFDAFRAQTTEDFARASYEHIARSHSVSIDKAREVLGYRPHYTSLGAVAEALEWLRAAGRASVPEFTTKEQP